MKLLTDESAQKALPRRVHWLGFSSIAVPAQPTLLSRPSKARPTNGFVLSVCLFYGLMGVLS